MKKARGMPVTTPPATAPAASSGLNQRAGSCDKSDAYNYIAILPLNE